MNMIRQMEAWERAFAARGFRTYAALRAAGVPVSAWGKWKRGECGCTMKTAAKIDAWLDSNPIVKDIADAT